MPTGYAEKNKSLICRKVLTVKCNSDMISATKGSLRLCGMNG